MTTSLSSADRAASSAPSGASVGIGWCYGFLLAAQTIGAFILYWKALPLYRQLVAGLTAYELRDETRFWSLSAIALIQVGYWVCYRIRAPLPRFTNVVLGHVVLFFARLSFVVATTVFSFVFIAHKLNSQLPLGRSVLTVAGLFSLFCYMLELQRLGTAFLGHEKKSDAPAR